MSLRSDAERLAALEEEIARLHSILNPRASRRAAVGVRAGLTLLVAGFVVCAAGANQDRQEEAASRTSTAVEKAGEITELIRARRIAVVDESGRDRVVIQTKKENGGAGAVVVKSGSGRVLAAIGEDGQGQGRVQLYDPAKGIIRAEMLVQKDGTAGILLRDRDTSQSKGRTRATVWVRPDGTPELTLRDTDSNVRVASAVLANGNAFSTLRDRQGTNRVMLAVESDGTSGVRLFEGPEKYRAGMTLLPDGSPGLTLLNGSGNGGIQMTMEATGKRGGLLLRDRNGKDRMRLTLTEEGPALLQSLSKGGGVEATWPLNGSRD